MSEDMIESAIKKVINDNGLSYHFEDIQPIEGQDNLHYALVLKNANGQRLTFNLGAAGHMTQQEIEQLFISQLNLRSELPD